MEVRGELRFDDVSFQYVPRPLPTPTRDVSFKVEPDKLATPRGPVQAAGIDVRDVPAASIQRTHPRRNQTSTARTSGYLIELEELRSHDSDSHAGDVPIRRQHRL